MTFHIRVRAGAIIIENESILLIEFGDENGLHYNLPGGGVEPGETVKTAAAREVMEEARCRLMSENSPSYMNMNRTSTRKRRIPDRKCR